MAACERYDSQWLDVGPAPRKWTVSQETADKQAAAAAAASEVVPYLQSRLPDKGTFESQLPSSG